MTEITYTSAALFVGKDEIVQAIYTRLLEALRILGPVQEDPKKTSFHLTSAAFDQSMKDAKSGNF